MLMDNFICQTCYFVSLQSFVFLGLVVCEGHAQSFFAVLSELFIIANLLHFEKHELPRIYQKKCCTLLFIYLLIHLSLYQKHFMQHVYSVQESVTYFFSRDLRLICQKYPLGKCLLYTLPQLVMHLSSHTVQTQARKVNH